MQTHSTASPSRHVPEISAADLTSARDHVDQIETSATQPEPILGDEQVTS